MIANSWDADATEVDVDFDLENKAISVKDNGCGMNQDEINGKYLYVGYRKRKEGSADDSRTPKGRRPMGRKGIGKLSLFSIANKIEVQTRVAGGRPEAFLMDADKIKAAINAEDSSMAQRYEPEVVRPNEELIDGQGTRIRITDLKKPSLNRRAINGLRQRIARRFSIISSEQDFMVRVDGEPVSLADRQYFHKARFIYQYNGDYAKHCQKLETTRSGNGVCAFRRPHRFDRAGVSNESGEYSVKGWIAIAWRSNDLDGDTQDEDDNLNKITVVVRGKVAQEDILQNFRLGGMITKYMFGEIEADFLDEDKSPDIATSSRQSISEEDERYRALVKFIHSELKTIWGETNKLKERSGVRRALRESPRIKEWYDNIRPKRLQGFADKIFGDIEKAGIEDAHRYEAYANGILLFEHLKLKHAMELIGDIDITKVNELLAHLRDIDALEAEHYRKIVEGRLEVIKKLQEHVDEDARERTLQEYVFDHLYLLDPAWERATGSTAMEKKMERVLEGTDGKNLRVDIQYVKYRKVAASHVIVELKRSSVKMTKTDLESQVRGYIDAVKEELTRVNDKLPVETICILGKLPKGWENPETRKTDETSLQLYGIRVVTYEELINGAYDSYKEFLKATESMTNLRELISEIRAGGAETRPVSAVET